MPALSSKITLGDAIDVLDATPTPEELRFLVELIRMRAEAEGVDNPKDVPVTNQVLLAYAELKNEIKRVLKNTQEIHDLLVNPYTDVYQLSKPDGIISIILTLMGEGAGVGDSEWDHIYLNPQNTADMANILQRKLQHQIDITGGGSFNEALGDAVAQVGAQISLN